MQAGASATGYHKPLLSSSPRQQRQKPSVHDRQQRNQPQLTMLDSMSSQNNKVPAAPQSGQSTSTSNVQDYQYSCLRSNSLRPQHDPRGSTKNMDLHSQGFKAAGDGEHDAKGGKHFERAAS